MTTVHTSNYKGTTFLSILGHAGYAEEGKDIVCASVSILTYTLVKCLENEESKGHLKDYYSVLNSGNADIMFEPCYLCNNPSITMFETVMEGFKLLAETYPTYVTIT